VAKMVKGINGEIVKSLYVSTDDEEGKD